MASNGAAADTPSASSPAPPAETPAETPASTPAPPSNTAQPDPQTNGAPKPAESKGKKGKEPAKDTKKPSEPGKLTGAELKAKAKAEKAARRAQQKGAAGAGEGAPPQPGAKGESNEAQKPKGGQQKGGDAKGQGQQQQKGPGSNSSNASSKNLPVRPGGAQQPPAVAAPLKKPEEEKKKVDLFRHLYVYRNDGIAGAGKDIHPAVLALGQKMVNYMVCGSNARLVATLQAFKHVIQDYITPPGNTLTRHLTSHVLSPQIEYLVACRPMSISMGNAIRWLKIEISKISPDLPEGDAKTHLCEAIDVFIRDRVTAADAIIASQAAAKIVDGDVILTYAKSSIVQQTLVKAHCDGKKFRVIVVDSRPLREGMCLTKALVTLGMDVKYCLLNGLSHCVRDATKVMIGAHAMMSNGRLYSRVGTALVAMEASDAEIPVIVLCGTVKFTERVALDSIVHNEIAPAEEMLIREGPGKGVLQGWEDVKNLHLLNPMFDVTPAEYIRMLVTELGVVPPTSVPVLHRLGNEGI